MPSIADEFDYKLDHVKTTSVSSGDIDKTFRSSCIGEFGLLPNRVVSTPNVLTETARRPRLGRTWR